MVAVSSSTPSAGPAASKKPEADAAASPQSEALALPILHDTTTSRASHGLKHGDYLRYRRYCTRRLARLRAACGLQNKSNSNPVRYTAKPLVPAAVLAAPRALAIPLVCAERAWAHAMDTKAQQHAGPARTRRVVLAKLRRAIFHAEQLSALCVDVAPEETVLEAEAYLRGMTAALALEEERWTAALSAYQTVQKIYTGMAGVRAGTVSAGLFERRLEEVAQGMRFCRYNLARSDGGAEDDTLLEGLRNDADATGGPANMLAEKIEAALVEARKRAAVSFGEVTWCGVVVMLRAERVREAVLLASEESKAFSAKEAAVDAYDKLFMVYHDAIKVVSDELAEFRASGSAADDRIRELEYLVAYLSFNRLQHTVSRNLLLVESFRNKRSSKPDDFVRLYDNLISNMTDILGLPGVDQDAAMSNEAESKRKLFQAHRCFHLAQCYLAVDRQSEAAALFDRVRVHATSLTGKYAEEAAKVVSESTGMKYRAQAQAFLKEHELSNGISELDISSSDVPTYGKVRMIDHLDSFLPFAGADSHGRVICEMPPPLEAVPCKPVLFDLAIDGIRFPEAQKQEDEKPQAIQDEEKEQAPSSTFASTRLGRWWSGKS